MREVLVLMGYFALDEPSNQESMQWGSPPSLLSRLLELPFVHFHEPELVSVLFPTLIAACHASPSNTAVVSAEMSASLLDQYLAATLSGVADARNAGVPRTVYLHANEPAPTWATVLPRFPRDTIGTGPIQAGGDI